MEAALKVAAAKAGSSGSNSAQVYGDATVVPPYLYPDFHYKDTVANVRTWTNTS